MFTVDQIKAAHSKVKSGADFPEYIREIKDLGVRAFTTYVSDSHTEYSGSENYRTSSLPMYEPLQVANVLDKERFVAALKIHQAGQTDYLQFCRDCADNGIAYWVCNLTAMTCIYLDKKDQQILVETIPG